MSVSATSAALPTTKADLVVGNGGRLAGRIAFGSAATGTTGLVVECSSRPQKKATAHHRKTRPRKTQQWDVRRKGPTPYPLLPALPPEWTLLSGQEGEQQQQPRQEEVVTSSSPSSSP